MQGRLWLTLPYLQQRRGESMHERLTAISYRRCPSIPNLLTTVTWAVGGISEVQLPSLSILEAHYNLVVERVLDVQGARLNEAQPAPLIDSHGLAMGIPVGEKPLLLCSCQDVVSPCAAFVCPDTSRIPPTAAVPSEGA